MSLINKFLAIIVIYIRVSSSEQAADGASLEAQVRNAKMKAEELGLKGEFVIFSDAGVSASNVPMADRKGLMDCIDYIKKNKPRVLLVWKRDRLARNSEEYNYIIKTIMKNDAEIIFFGKDEPPIGTGMYAGIQEAIISNLAEIESKQLRNRILDTRKSIVLNGDAVICVPPYAYSYCPETKSYLLDENQAAVVREIYELYLSGTIGVNRIAKHLNEKGIMPRNGDTWCSQSVLHILKNPFYYGSQKLSYVETKDNKEVRTNIVQHCDKIHPIITEEEYQAAQVIVKNHNKNANCPPRQYTTSFLLSGVLYCSKCDYKYTSRVSTYRLKNGTQSRYESYQCMGHQHAICNGHIKKDDIESKVIAGILQELERINMDQVLIEANSELDHLTTNYQTTIDSIRKDLQPFSRKIEINQNKLESTSDVEMQEYFQKRIKDLLKDRNEKEKLLAETEAELVQLKETSFDAIKAYQRLANWGDLFESASLETKRAIVLEVVDKIMFDPDSNIANVTLKLDHQLMKSCDLYPTPNCQCNKDHSLAKITFSVKVA